MKISICFSEASLSAKWIFHNHAFSSSVLSEVHVSVKVGLIEHASGQRISYQSVGTWFDIFTTIKKIKQHLHARNKLSSSIVGNKFMELEQYVKGR